MKTLMKDKAFFVCAIVFLLALGKVIYNRIPSQNVDLRSSVTEEKTYRQKLWDKADARPVNRGSANLPVRKSRPKSGTEWLAGKSDKADSWNIDAIFNNMVEGDTLKLEPGDHSVNLSNIPKRFDVRIKGSEGSQLIITEGTVSMFTTLTFENLNVKVDLARSRTLFLGDNNSTVQFIHSTIDGNDTTFYLADKMTLKFKDSKVNNCRISLQDRAKLFYEDSIVSSENEDLAVMSEISEVTVKNTKITGFGRYAFYFLSEKSKLNMDNVQVSNGDVLYGGKYLKSQVSETGVEATDVQESTTANSCENCTSRSH